MPQSVANFKLNNIEFTFTSGEGSVVKIENPHGFPVSYFSIFLEPIRFVDDTAGITGYNETIESILWLLHPYENGKSKISIQLDNSPTKIFDIKLNNQGDKFSNPIIYSRTDGFDLDWNPLQPEIYPLFGDKSNPVTILPLDVNGTGDYISFRVIANDKDDYSTPANMAIINSKLKDVRFIFKQTEYYGNYIYNSFNDLITSSPILPVNGVRF